MAADRMRQNNNPPKSGIKRPVRYEKGTDNVVTRLVIRGPGRPKGVWAVYEKGSKDRRIIAAADTEQR
jgi:hypothetical protein